MASVSSIFGLGSPEQYNDHVINVRVGDVIERNDLMRRLVDIQFQRNDIDFQRGRFRARGDVLEVFPASSDAKALRIEFFGDEVDRIREVDSLTGEVTADLDLATIFPATHFMTNDAIRDRALKTIQAELDAQLKVFEEEGKLLEAQRLKQRTEYDIEMIREMGFTSGIENYSRHMDGRAPGNRHSRYSTFSQMIS